jgi:hypothetical protein
MQLVPRGTDKNAAGFLGSREKMLLVSKGREKIFRWFPVDIEKRADGFYDNREKCS